MTYCLNPGCQQPQNPDDAEFCQSCGAKLVSLLRGRYRVLHPIGQGGFGRTYLAVDEDRLKTRCVIKQFSPQLQGTRAMEKAMQLFDQEAMRLHELGEHPHIPTLLAYFEHDNRLYLVQQFVEGQTLAQEVQHEGSFPEQKIREVLVGLLPTLKFVHDHQVIHRDITPANIIRRKLDNRLVLIDFGVSKLLTTGTTAQPGTKIGTEGYAPMEQLRSGRAYPASDLYSLGATCLYLMTLVKPEDLYDPLTGAWRWREHLAKKGMGISDPLGYILDKLLKDLVNERYQTADEVMRDLRRALAIPPLQGAAETSAASLGRSLSRPPANPSAPRSAPARPSAPPPPPPPPSPPIRVSGSVSGNRNPPSRPPVSGHGQNRRCLHTLQGHTRWVTTVAMSGDGSLVASGGLDSTIKLWNGETGELLQTLTGHPKDVNCVAFTADRQIVISGSDDNTIRLWQVSTGKLLRTLTGHARDVSAIALSHNGQLLISGGEDRTVRLWRLATGEPLRVLSGIAGIIKAVAISPDDQTIASGGLDNQIKLWNPTTGELVRSLIGHFNSVMAVAITPDGHTVVSGSKDKTIRLWNLKTGELIRSLVGHSDTVNAVAISPDGLTLVSGSSDTTIRLWNLKTGDLLSTLTGHSNPVTAVSIGGNGRLFASGSYDNTVRVWQMTE